MAVGAGVVQGGAGTLGSPSDTRKDVDPYYDTTSVTGTVIGDTGVPVSVSYTWIVAL